MIHYAVNVDNKGLTPPQTCLKKDTLLRKWDTLRLVMAKFAINIQFIGFIQLSGFKIMI